MEKFVKIMIMTLLITVMTTFNVCAEFPGRVFAPYIDTCLWPTPSIKAYQKTTSQDYFTLAFIISDPQGKPSWGGYHSMDERYYMGEIQAVRSAGGDVIISFGGANGQELALWHKDVAELQAAYQSVIDLYGVKWVDFDIEGMAVAERPSIDRRNKAIKGLQEANPDLTVAFCLPVLPQGLTADGLYVIQNAKDNGVRIDLVNVMAMDYGDSAAPEPEGKMGRYAIDAATNTHQQMEQIGVETKIGVTPMIGQNDVNTERFYLRDAELLYEWATSEGQLPWVGMLSMWSGARDNGGCPGQLSPNCSGIEQVEYAFTRVFMQYLSSSTGNAYPNVSISAPPDGAAFEDGTNITVTADASDTDGTIQKVEFHLDSTPVGESNTPPFRFKLAEVKTGVHTLTAIATDNEGDARTAAPIKIFVGAVCVADPWEASRVYDLGDIVAFGNRGWRAKWYTQGDKPGSGGKWGVWEDRGACGGGTENVAPTVSITSPTSGDIFDSGSEILIQVDAQDPDGRVTRVEFFNGDVSLGVDDEPPFRMVFIIPSAGICKFTAVAEDDEGVKGTSDAVRVSRRSDTQDCGYSNWISSQNWTEYNVGDRKINAGKVWECHNVAYSYWEPSGPQGHFGWTFISDCN